MSLNKRESSAAAGPELPQPGFRSGAVARMAGMPVSTLRIWEQRYRAVEPCTTAAGHRLYSRADIERVTLMRRLTEHGHAIGLLAGWTTEQLREAVPSLTQEAPLPARGSPAEAPRIIVIGKAMALRLERLQLRKLLKRPVVLAGVFETLAAALDASPAEPASAVAVPAVQLLLVQEPHPQVDMVTHLRAAQRAWHARTAAVSYRFTHAQVRQALSGAGVELVREPGDDQALATWLDNLSLPPDESPRAVGDGFDRGQPAWSADALGLLQSPVLPPPRYEEIALTAFAGMSTRVACECPRHVAELLMQIGSFERYSASCASLRPADAALHAHLQQTAGVARVLFETALQRVADAEGIEWS